MAKTNEKSKSKATKTSPKEVKDAVRSTSPLAGFYEMWNGLGELDATTPKDLFAIIKKLADTSKSDFFYSPAPMPGPAEMQLRKLLAEDVVGKSDDDLQSRRDILRQFKHYLRHQVQNRKMVHDEAYQHWQDALQKLESEVAWFCQGKMSRTTYRSATIDAIFTSASKACDCLWVKHQLKMSHLPTPADKERAIEIKVAKFADDKKFSKRQDLIDAYRATLQYKPFAYSAYAQSLGIKCDQKRGLFYIRGREKPFRIPSSSVKAWLVIRLLVETTDESGVAQLFPGWGGTFSQSNDETKNDKYEFRTVLIYAADPGDFNNNKRYRLKAPRKRQ